MPWLIRILPDNYMLFRAGNQTAEQKSESPEIAVSIAAYTICLHQKNGPGPFRENQATVIVTKRTGPPGGPDFGVKISLTKARFLKSSRNFV